MIHDLSRMTPQKAMRWLEDRVALKSPEAEMIKNIIKTFSHQAGLYEISARTVLNVLRIHQDDPSIPKDALLAVLAPIKGIIAQYPTAPNGHKPATGPVQEPGY